MQKSTHRADGLRLGLLDGDLDGSLEGSLEGDLEGILFVGAMLTEGMADTEG